MAEEQYRRDAEYAVNRRDDQWYADVADNRR